MQKSKSSVSFGPTTEHAEVTDQARFQRRSSLDRFVIHGRTRLPSSETSKSSISSQDATNMQIAQTLLDYRDMPRSMPVSYRPNPHISDRSGYELGSQRSPSDSSEQHTIDAQTTLRPKTRRGGHPHILGSSHQQSINVASHHGAGTQTLLTVPRHSVTDTPADLYQHQTDGPSAAAPLRQLSSMASTSWETISRRIASNSSGGSQASRAAEFRHEYNTMAEKHGLSLLTGDLSEKRSSSPTKAKQKPNPGWFKRNILRRSSSAISLKPKETPLRKRSFGGLRSRSVDTPTNVLTGRALDETCRLGGIDNLVLPSNLAINKLEIPRSLSATGAYLLEYGCDAPGIFRISGTKKTIDTLHYYFDHQFSDAGSPSKVVETVAVGFLPSEVEYTLPDISSLFKKIIIGLPGGLLGSLQLFEVLRSILLDQHADLGSQHKAFLVALAIFSVPDVHRMHLIQAVIGLVAYFGSEGDKARMVEKMANNSQTQRSQPDSEIMGCHNLGTVLGPLLLGDLTESIDVSNDRTQDSTGALDLAEYEDEQSNKSKNPKRNTVPDKLKKDATLSTHVERAKLTASLMGSLLANWQEIIKQLRELSGVSQYSVQIPSDQRQNENQPRRATSGLTLRNSDEEAQFHDVLRGRKLPRDLSAPAEGRTSSRSPAGRRTVEFSKDSNATRTWLPEASLRDNDASPAGSNTIHITGPRGSEPVVELRSRNPSYSQGLPTEDIPGFSPEKRTDSDLAMERMSKGTILKGRNDSSTSFEQAVCSRDTTPIRTPRMRPQTSSSSHKPETAIRRVITPAQHQDPIPLLNGSFVDKPLPPIGDAQRREGSFPSAYADLNSELHERIISNRKSRRSHSSTESSPLATRRPTPRTLFPSREKGKLTPPILRDSEDRVGFPPRQSSLSPSDTGTNNRLPTFGTLKEYQDYLKSDPNSLPPRPITRKASEVLSRWDPKCAQNEGDNDRSVTLPSHDSFATPRTTYNDEEAQSAVKARDMASVYANLHPTLPERSTADPFISSVHVNPSRTTLIPKPVRDVGCSRNSESSRSPMRKPSPPKRRVLPTSRDHLAERPSTHDVVYDKDAEIIRANGNIRTDNPSNALSIISQMPLKATQRMGSHQASVQVSDAHRDRLISNVSSSGIENATGKPSVGPESLSSIPSVNAGLTHSQDGASGYSRGHPTPSSPSRVNSPGGANHLSEKLERHGSTSSALYQKTVHLQSEVEQLQEEKQALKRSLDAVTEAKSTEPRGFDPSNPSSRGSWTNNMYNEEAKDLKQKVKELERNIKELKREKSFWKRRAQEAEQDLANNGSADSVIKRYHVDVDDLSDKERRSKKKAKDGAATGNDVNLKVLLDVDGEKPDNADHLYEDEGWGSREVEGDIQIGGI